MTNDSPIKPYREERPWGKEEWFPSKNVSMVKLLTVNPGEELSLQYHNNRDEFGKIISGDGFVVLDKETKPIKKDDEYFVPRKFAHRLIGGKEPLLLLEISLGDFDENDIVRLEDKYNRIK